MSAIAFDIPKEISAVADSLRAFADSEVIPRHEAHREFFENPRRLYREDGRFSDELVGLIGEVRRAAAQASYYSMCVPEAVAAV